MATKTAILGAALGATVLVGGVVTSITTGAKPQPAVKKNHVPPDAKHLWAEQPDGGNLLREPLPTLDDGGCQAWAARCADGVCKGSCE